MDKCSCSWDGSGFSSCGLCGQTHTGLGQARVWATSIAPTVGPGTWLLQSWDLTSVDLCQWTGENNTWESPGPFVGIPTVKVGPKAGPTTVYPWAHTPWERRHNKAHSKMNSPREGILRAFSPSGSAPIPPTSHLRSETQRRNRSWGPFFDN